MRYLKTTLLLLLVSLCSSAHADDVQITYTSDFILKIDGLPIEANTQIAAVFQELGEASRNKTLDDGESIYYYDEVGIVIFTQNNLVRGVGVNFNWDGDEKFSSTPFKGTLTIGGATITSESSQDDFESMEGIQFQCPISIMCANSDQSAKVKCTVAFEEEEISQVVFLCH